LIYRIFFSSVFFPRAIRLFCLLCFSASVSAGKPLVEAVVAECNQQRICKFEVTIRHADEGWAHFVNGFEIFSLQGERLAHEAFAGPHMREQSFTRTLRKVSIPPAVDTVIIRAHDIKHGESDRKYVMKLKFIPD